VDFGLFVVLYRIAGMQPHLARTICYETEPGHYSLYLAD
jgi:hypothetical protein